MKKIRKLAALGCLLIVVIIAFSLSFAYYKGNVEKINETETDLKTKKLALIFEDTKEVNVSNFLPGTSVEKTFSVKSDSDDVLTYNIRISDITNTFSDDVLYTLYCDGQKLTDQARLPKTSDDAYIFTNLTINPGETKNYTLKLEYVTTDEKQTFNSSNEFAGTVNIDLVNNVDALVYTYEDYAIVSNTNKRLKFEVKNISSTTNSRYNVKLQNVVNEYEGLNYTLKKNGVVVQSGTIPSGGDLLYLLTNQSIGIGKVDKYILEVTADGSHNFSAIAGWDSLDVDATAPQNSIEFMSKTTNSLTYKVRCSDTDSGISQYYFYKDGTLIASRNSSENEIEYTYEHVTEGNHQFTMSCSNAFGYRASSSDTNSPNVLVIDSIEVDESYDTTEEITLSHNTAGDYIFRVSGVADADNEVATCTLVNECFDCDDSITTTSLTEGTYYKLLSSPVKLSYRTNGTLESLVTDGVNTKRLDVITIDTVDTTDPNSSVTLKSKTSNSTTLTLGCSDLESPISKYQIYLDNTLKETIETSDITREYTLNGLTTGNHTYKLVCTNEAGLTGTDEKQIETESLVVPTYSSPSGYAQSKNVTIDYSGEGNYLFKTTGEVSTETTIYPCSENNGNYTCSDTAANQIIANTWYKTNNDITLTFTSNGTVIAKVNDGTNEEAASARDILGIDRTAPTINISTDYTAGSWTKDNVTVSINSTDADSGVAKYEINRNNEWQEVEDEVTFSSDMNETVSFRTTDAVGNISEERTLEIKIDKTAPTCGNYGGQSTEWTKENRTITVTCDDSQSGCETASANETITYNVHTYNETIKNTDLSYVIKDKVGNERTCVGEVNVYVDKTAPSCTISGNPSSFAASATLKVTGSDNESGLSDNPYSWDGTTYGTNADLVVDTNGTYTAYVKDAVGNTNTCDVSVNKIDKTAPTLSITSNATSGTWTKNNVTLTLVGDDGAGSGVDHYEINENGTWTTTENILNFTSNMNETLTFRAIDRIGNISEERSFEVKIDKTAPVAVFEPDENKIYAKSQALKVTVSDLASGVASDKLKYQWTQSSEAPAANTFTTSFTNEDTIVKSNDSGNNWYLWVYIEDTVGNSAILSSKEFYLDNTPPSCNISIDSNGYTLNKVLTINSSDEHVGGVSYSWDGTNYGSDNTQSITSNGTYVGYVKDALGNTTSCSVDITKIDREGPSFSITTSYTAGTWTKNDVTLTLNGNDGTGVGVDYYEVKNNDTWTRVTGSSVTYNSTIDETVTYRAKDKLGNVSEERSIALKIDKTSPSVTFAPNTNTTYAKTQSTEVTITDANSGLASNTLKYAWSNNGETAPTNLATTGGTAFTLTDSKATITTPNNLDGTYYLWIYAEDSLGNSSTVQSGAFNLDNTAPTCNVSINSNSYELTKTLTAVATDAGAGGITYLWNTTETTSSIEVTSNGTYTVTVKDSLNNSSTCSVDVTKVDRKGPSFSISTSYTSGTWTKDDVTLTLNGNDAGIGVDYYEVKNGNTWTKVTGSSVTYDSSMDETVTYRAKDKLGNVSEERSIEIKIDKTKPTVEFNPNANTTYAKTQSTQVTVTDIASGVASNKLKYAWSTNGETAPSNLATTGGTAFTNEATIETPANLTGTYYLWIYAEDSVGNSKTTKSGAFRLDNTPPSCTISGNPSSWTTSATLTASATDDHVGGVTYLWNTGATTAELSGITTNGRYTVTVKDSLNNSASCYVDITKIDREGPSFSISTSYTSGTWTKDDVILTLNGNDAGIGVDYYEVKNGNTWTKVTGSSVTYDSSIDETVTYRAKDKLGNVSEERSIALKIDKAKPTITFNPNANTTYAKTQSTQVTVNDTASGVATNKLKYAWSTNGETAPANLATTGGTAFTNEATIETPTNLTGDYYLWIYAEDSVGNNKTVQSGAFKLDNTAPTCNISISPSGYATSKELTITSTDSHSGDITYSWDGTNYSNNNKLTVEANGEYRAYVKDKLGNTVGCTANVSGIDREGPSFSISTSYTSGTWTKDDVTLTLNGNDAGIGVDYYEVKNGNTWTKVTGSSVTYDSNMDETVTYRAKDKLGNVSEERSIELKIDKTNPAITLGSNGDNTYEKEKTVNVSIRDLDSGLATGSNLQYGWSTSTSTEPNLWTEVNPSYTAGTTDAVTFEAKTNLLPSEYQQVEYIESTGTQYIDTGYYWQHENIEIDFSGKIVTNSTWQSLFGNEEYISDSNRYFAGVMHGQNGSYGMYIGTTSQGSFNAAIGQNFQLKIKTTADKNLKIYKDGVQTLSTTYTGSVMTKQNASLTSNVANTVGNIFIFANHNTSRGATNEAIQIISSMDLYSFRLIDNGVVVRDFIPCYEKSTGRAGLYDLVNGTFYPNAATSGSDFKYGPTYTGSYYLWVKPVTLKDVATNSKTDIVKSSSTFKLDNTAPSCSISGNPSDWASSATLTASATDGHAGGVTYSWNTGATTAALSGITTNGRYTVTVKDSLNNSASCYADVTKIDVDDPTLSISTSYQSGTWTKNDVTLTLVGNDGSGSGIDYYEVKNGNTWTKITGNVVTFDSSMDETVTYRAKDKLGNPSQEQSIEIKIDKTEPEISFSPNANTTVSKSQSTQVTVTDTNSRLNATTLKYAWSTSNTTAPSNLATTGGTAFTLDANNHATISKADGTGTFYLWIYAADNVGNTKTLQSGAFKLDNTPPSCSISGNPSSWTTSATLTASATDTGGANGVTYSWNTGATTAATSISANGTYTVTVKDSLQNSASCSVNVTKIDSTKPEVSITETGKTSKSITVEGSCADEESGVVEYQFYYDGDLDKKYTTSAATQTHTYTDTAGQVTEGNHSLKLVCKNGAQNTDEDVITASPLTLCTPDYSVASGYAQSKTTTINYASSNSCAGGTKLFKVTGTATSNVAVKSCTQNTTSSYTCSTSVAAGTTLTANTWYSTESNPTLTFTSNGTVVAKTADGVNSKTGSSLDINGIDRTKPAKPTYAAKFASDDTAYTSGTYTNKQVYTIISTTDLVPSGVNESESGVVKIQQTQTPNDENSWGDLSLWGNGISKSGNTYSGSEPWTLRNRNQTYYFRAVDAAGNKSESSDAFNIRYDLDAPTMTASPANLSSYVKSQTVEVSLQDSASGLASGITAKYGWSTSNTTEPTSYTNATVASYTAGTTSNTKIFDASASGLTGTYYLWVTEKTSNTMKDTVGNKTTTQKFGPYYFDNTPPSPCSITAGNDSWAASKTLSVGTATDTNGVNYKITKTIGGTTTTVVDYTSTKPADRTITENGTYTLYLKDNVGTGNSTSCSVTVSKIDRTAPYITAPAGDSTYSKTKSVEVTIGDTQSGLATGSSVQYAWSTSNTTAPTSWTAGTVSSYSAGASTAKVTVSGSELTGSYYLWIHPVTLKDTLQNSQTTNVVSTGTYKFDNTAPEGCSIGGNTSTCSTSKTLTMGTATDSHNGTVNYSWNNSSWSATKSDKSVTENGTYTLYVKDGLGNNTSCSTSVTTIDKTGPGVTYGTNGNSTYATSHSTTVTVADVGCSTVSTLKYMWSTSDSTPSNIATSGTAFTSGSTISTPSDSTTGNYYLHVYATDGLGNVTNSHTNVFKLDKTGPSVTYGTNGSTSCGASKSTTVTVADSHNATVSVRKYMWSTSTSTPSNIATSGTNFTSGSTISTPSDSTSGTYYLHIYTTDGLGNVTNSHTNGFTIDKTGPSVTFGTNGATCATSKSTTVTVTDGCSPVKNLKYAWSTSNTTTPTFSTTFASGDTISTPSNVTGTYYLWIYAEDSLGNPTTTKSNGFALDKTAPGVTFGTNGNSAYAKSVSTTATTTDSGYGCSSVSENRYMWSTSTSEPSNIATSGTTFTSGGTITKATETGTYYLWVYRKDALGNSTSSRSNAFYIDNTGPYVDTSALTGDSTYQKTKSITVTIKDDHAGLANGNILKYGWSTSTTTAPTSWTEATVSTTAGSKTATFTASGSGLTGSYYLWITPKTDTSFKDTLGTATTTSSIYKSSGTYKFDNTAPSPCTITAGNNSWTTSKTLSVTAATDTNGVNYKLTKTISGTTTVMSNYSSTKPADQTITENGTYTLYLKDGLENETSCSVTVSKIDRTNPTVSTYAGAMLYKDPTFASGSNSVAVYNNNGNGVVTHQRLSGTTPEGSNYIHIKTAGSASPGLGGFYFGTPSAASKVFVTRIVAKIPVGYKIDFQSNAFGNGASANWITSNLGTGQWKEYLLEAKCGSSGTFSSTNFFNLTALSGYSTTSVEWDLAYATVFDTTKWDKKNYVISAASDSQSGVAGYGLNQSSTTAPTYTTFTGVDYASKVSEVSANGTYYAWYKDAVGNANKASATVSYVDSSKPTISFGTNGNSTAKQSHSTTVTLGDTGSGIKASSIKYAWSDSSTTQPTINNSLSSNGASVSTPSGVTGTRYLWVYAEDNVGNSDVFTSGAFVIDNTPPSCSITGNPSSWVTSATLTASSTDTGGANGITYLWSTGATTASISASNTSYTVTCSDAAGNSQTSSSVTVSKIDTTKPYITAPAGDSTYSKTKSVEVTIGDTQSGLATGASVQYAWSQYNDTAHTPTSWTAGTISSYSAGASTAKVTVSGSDLTGSYYLWIHPVTLKDTLQNSQTANVVSTGTYKFDNTAPSCSITGNPSSWVTSATLTASASDDHSKGITYLWSTGATTASISASNTSYTVTCSDAVGNSQTSSSVTVSKIDTTKPYITQPAGDNTPKKDRTVSVTIGDTQSGLATGASVQYAWSQYNDTAHTPTSWTDGTISSYNAGAATATMSVPSGSGKNGSWYLWIHPVTLKDTLQNSQTTNVVSGVYKFDNTAPSCSISGAPSSWVTSATLTASGSDDSWGAGGVTYLWNTTETTASISVTANNTYTVTCSDSLGNSTTANATISKIDRTAPYITAPAGDSTYAKTKSVEVTIGDTQSGLATGASVQYAWSQYNDTAHTPTSWTAGTVSSYSAGASTAKVTVSGSNLTGSYYLWIHPVTLKDTLQNSQTTNVVSTGTYKFDNKAPINCSVSASPSTCSTSKSITIGTATDEHNGTVYYKWGSGSYATTKPTVSDITENGTYTLYVKDGLENSTSCSASVTNIDRSGPNVTFGTNGNSTYATSRSTTVTVADVGCSTVSTLKYMWSTSATTPSNIATSGTAFTSGATISTPSKSGTTPTGDYYLHIYATDALGNVTNTHSNVFKLDNTAPVCTWGSFTPAFIKSGTSNTSTITLTCTDSHSGVPTTAPTITKSTNFTATVGTPTASGTSASRVFTYTVTAPASNTSGTLTASALTDSAGNAMTSKTSGTLVVDGNAPTISVSIPANNGTTYTQSKTASINVNDSGGSGLVAGSYDIYYAWGTSTQACSGMTSKVTVPVNAGASSGTAQNVTISSQTGAGSLYICTKVAISDRSGNSLAANSSASTTAYLDNTKPTMTLTVPDGSTDTYAGTTYRKSHTGKVTLYENLGSTGYSESSYTIRYVWSTSNVTTCNSTSMPNTTTVTPGGGGYGEANITINSGTGAGKLYICNASAITDIANNSLAAGTITSANMYLDNTPPSCTIPTIAYTPSGTTYANSVSLTASATDGNVGGVTYSWKRAGSSSTLASTATLSGQTENDTYTVTCSDSLGNSTTANATISKLYYQASDVTYSNATAGASNVKQALDYLYGELK